MKFYFLHFIKTGYYGDLNQYHTISVKSISYYVGETKRNVEVRYSEHNHPSGKSESSKHLHQNINHVFNWSVICSAPKSDRTR